MQSVGDAPQTNLIWLLFSGGGVALYIAARSAADALTAGQTPGAARLAIANWMPILLVALTAVLLNQPAVAVGVIFATSVASLTLGVGTITLLADSLSPLSKNAWPMILPTALLVFLAGFRGELTILHAIILAAQGIVILIICNSASTDPPSDPKYRWLRLTQFLLSAALAGIGAWSILHGVDRASHANETASPGVLAATFLSPLLLLPLLGHGVDLVHRNLAEVAATAFVGLTLLNICALLPLLIAISYLKFLNLGGALQLPLAVWRVDIVALIVLGLFLLPVGLGRWKLSRIQGLGLIGGYAAYLALSLLLGIKSV